MVVKSLLISGNLPENGITFCYKPQSCQKPGFPRMTSLCAAEHQRACSAGCQRVKQKTRSGKAGKPRGGGAGCTELSSRSTRRGASRLDTTGMRGCWHQQEGSLVLWALPSAAWGEKSSPSGLEGSPFACWLSSQRGAQRFPTP